MFLFDPSYFTFALPALLLAFYAQNKVRTDYGRYLETPNSARVTRIEGARRLLSAHGLSAVDVETTPGALTAHHNSRTKELCLSQLAARSSSVAALAIVDQQVGHARQDSAGHALSRLRGTPVPVVKVGTWLGPILFWVGLFLRASNLFWAGSWLFSATLVFALVRLPVELDASRWALNLLRGSYVIDSAEMACGPC